VRKILTTTLCVMLGSMGAALATEAPEEIVVKLEAQQDHDAKPQRGRASYYASSFHGRLMANGERFDRHSNSAASLTLPLGTQAEVRNLENGRVTVVTIEDRGPYVGGRVIDVSPYTAELLGMRVQGTAMVEVTPIGLPTS